MKTQFISIVKILGTTALLLLLSTSALWTQEKMPVTTSSKEARQLFMEAREAYEMFKYERATSLFEKALELDPSFAMAHIYIAMNERRNTDLARMHLNEALDRLSQISRGEKHRILYIQSFFESNEKSRKKHLQALLELYPKDERIQYLAGNYYYRNDQYEKAVQHLKKATKLNEHYHPAFNMLGYNYMELDEDEKANQYFQKYVKLLPENAASNDSYAEFLLRQGRFEESIKYYKKALQTDPDFVYSYIGLGDNFLFKGKYDLARRHYRNAYKHSPNTGFKFNCLRLAASVDVHRNKPYLALKTLDEYIELADKKNLAYDKIVGIANKGWILTATGHTDEGLDYYHQAIKLIETEDMNKSRREYLRNLGQLWEFYALSASNKLEKAKSSRERCKSKISMNSNINNRNMYYTICGLLEIKKGNYDEALESLSDAGNGPLNWYYTGLAWEKLGNQRKANKYYQKVAKHYNNSILLSIVRNKALANLE